MRAVVLAALLASASPLFAPVPATALAAQAVAEASAFQRDRAAILAQAGQFRVRFAMHETVSFLDGYEPFEEKLSGGNEIVRVIHDGGDRISLQHILVMEHGGQTMVIKHWRQDWVYEPDAVLAYAGPDEWRIVAVPEDQRRGAWSQTVWQTDDSPRYGGVGRWTYDNGMAVWTSAPTWRPLARRDAVRAPAYDRYLSVNRHALTPWGWVHLQDNIKMAPPSGDGAPPTAVVHEDVTNTYRRWDGYDAAPGDAYWTATADYWAAVRGLWDAAAETHGGVIRVAEAPETGVVTGPPLMGLAQQVQDGELTTEQAVAQARVVIAEATRR